MRNTSQAIVKTLLLWLVLLALPLQGVAAAATPCAPASAAMQGEPPEHGLHQSHSNTDHHLPGKSGSTHDGCAACCLGALLPASLGLPAMPLASQPVTDRSGPMTSIVHTPPEHPPQALPA
jgi:hypothetical protein